MCVGGGGGGGGECGGIFRILKSITIASSTFFMEKCFPLPVIKEEQVVSHWQKNGHSILINFLQEGLHRYNVVK